MQGTIIQVNTSFGGLPKRAISGGFITPLGIKGDMHAHPAIHGGPLKAILIIASEVVDELTGRGYPLFYGALGENLTTRGLTSQLNVYGPTLKDELTDDLVQAWDYSSPRWGMSGFYASVLTPGPVQPDDIIAVVANLA